MDALIIGICILVAIPVAFWSVAVLAVLWPFLLAGGSIILGISIGGTIGGILVAIGLAIGVIGIAFLCEMSGALK